MTEQANNDTIYIKKYPNRRLYNTQTSCYVTLEDLCDMVKRGEIFEVKDAKTDDDLTRSVLTQIIFDQESKGYNLLPVGFLRQLISLYGNNLSNLVPNYLEVAMENFMKNQDHFKDFASGWEQFTPLGIFENITKQNIELFENTMKIFDSSKKND